MSNTGCGCGTMTADIEPRGHANGQHGCGCGPTSESERRSQGTGQCACGCGTTAKSRDEEIAELRNLRDSITQRLAELEEVARR